MLEWNAIAAWTVAVGIASSASCAILGCYLVLRRMSLLGDAISHSVLPGIAVAFLLTGSLGGWPMLVGAMALGALTTMLTELLHRKGRLAEDSSMGAVFTTLFAVGVVVIARAARNAHIDADCVLYGLIETVALDTTSVAGFEVPRAMLTVFPVLLLTIAFVALFWKELKIVSFDPALATAMGIRASVVHYLLMAMVAGVTVASFEAVGSILVIAMLIVPGATAHLLTDRLGRMMVLAALVAALSAVGGYWGAVALNTSLAGTMAVAAGVQLSLAAVLAPRHGIVTKLLRNAALSIRIVSEDLLAGLYREEERAGRAGGYATLPTLAGTGRIARWVGERSLRRRSLIAAGGGGTIALTDSGRREAEQLVRSHRLWESYLGENFELPADHLHEAAHRMEHYIGPELQKELAAELKDSSRDPHGRAIPGGG